MWATARQEVRSGPVFGAAADDPGDPGVAGRGLAIVTDLMAAEALAAEGSRAARGRGRGRAGAGEAAAGDHEHPGSAPPAAATPPSLTGRARQPAAPDPRHQPLDGAAPHGLLNELPGQGGQGHARRNLERGPGQVLARRSPATSAR